MIAKDLSFPVVDSEDWSDWVNAQADPSLRWAHMPFYNKMNVISMLNIGCFPYRRVRLTFKVSPIVSENLFIRAIDSNSNS